MASANEERLRGVQRSLSGGASYRISENTEVRQINGKYYAYNPREISGGTIMSATGRERALAKSQATEISAANLRDAINNQTPKQVQGQLAPDRKPTVQQTKNNNNNNRTTAKKAASPSKEDPVKNAEFRQSTNDNLQDSMTQNQNFGYQRNKGQSFNIARFRTEVTGNDGVLPTHSFLVTFAPMPWVIANNKASTAGVDSLLTMRCDNVVLPTLSLLQEQNIRRYGFGPVENVAYGVNVGDLNMQFIVDKEALIVDFFEAWMNKIVNRDSYGGANINNRLGVDKTPYEVAYKDDYACSSVNVFVYDRAQNIVMEYNIYDVFPTNIQSVNLSWAEENSLLRLNVTFSFTDLRIRPTFSAFDQDAGQRSGSKMFDSIRKGDVPDSITNYDVNQLPLTQPGSISIPSELSPPLIVGDGNNGVPRGTNDVPRDVIVPSNLNPESPTITKTTLGTVFPST